MVIAAGLVKELRERTGAGMMDCKKALVEVGGDLEQASELLRKAGRAKADKKASRVAAEGLVVVKEGSEDYHVVLEINSETDFVAKDENFVQYADSVAEAALVGRPVDVQELMDLEVDGKSIEAGRQQLVAKIGENVSVRRFALIKSDHRVGSYSHMGRIGVLVEVNGGTAELAKDLAMQVAATSPRYVNADEIPEDELGKEREILAAQAAQEGKPEQIQEKILDGKLSAFYKEIVLLEQVFIKDSKQTVEDRIKEEIGVLKENITVARITRWELGGE